MTQANDADRLRHMLRYAVEATGLSSQHSRADLDQDRVLNLALVRLLEIVGEAANRFSETTQQKYADIPWQAIVGLRNRLIHGYDEVDFDILWDILTVDLPPLVQRLKSIVDAND